MGMLRETAFLTLSQHRDFACVSDAGLRVLRAGGLRTSCERIGNTEPPRRCLRLQGWCLALFVEFEALPDDDSRFSC